jgi:creatinine amidohydrolase/Fe(II)-dependent formamide hydrolase-like protein
LIADAALDALGPDAVGHGGGDEAAVVLATRPDLVDRSELGARELNEPIRRVQSLVRAAGGVLPIAQHKTSFSGASGDSSGATAEAGSIILGRAAGQLRVIAEELLNLDVAPFRQGARQLD